MVSLLALTVLNLLDTHMFVAAQSSTDHYGDRIYGPWGFDVDVLTSFFDQPNATGNYPLAGPDWSSPAPNDPVDGWAWNIRVKSDIPISKTNLTEHYEKANQMSDYFTASQITLQAPSGEVDPTWEVCIIRWYMDENFAELREDDGTCSSVLEESCRSEMADAVSETWADNDGASRCKCPDMGGGSCGGPPAFSQGCTARRELDQAPCTYQHSHSPLDFIEPTFAH